MNLYIRLLYMFVASFFKKKIHALEETSLSFCVWPNDLDLNGHMNNGRYLSIMDIGRMDWVLRLGIAGFLWLNIMTLSTALYVGYFEQIADSVRRGLPFLLMALATPVVFY